MAEPMLSDDQDGLLHLMLPFPSSWGTKDGEIVIGKGPPGSGKTVLAMDAARTAIEACQYSVLILVPSRRLRADYERRLRLDDIEFRPLFRSLSATDTTSVTIAEATEFFSVFGNSEVPAASREALLDEWWKELLHGTTSLKIWAEANPDVETLRFRRLLDATLADPAGLGENSKDALDSLDQPLYRLVAAFRSKPTWRELARQTRRSKGLYLRSEIADAAGSQLCKADPWPERLLVLVDEVQDLVPAEWAALVGWCVARRRRGLVTRAVFFGDENQRVSPTSFSWNELRQHCRTAYKPEPAVREVGLPGSFRLSREVAYLAEGLFDKSVSLRGKTRQVERLDPSSLPPYGPVDIVVLPNAQANVAGALKHFNQHASGEDRLVAIMLAVPQGFEGSSATAKVDVLLPRIAKGLEFESLVVVEPFGGSGEKLSFDRASVAYTVLTRAQRKLLCVLTPAEWGLMRALWESQEIVLHELDESSGGRKKLQLLLSGVAGAVGFGQRAEITRNNLRDLLEHLPSSGSRTEGRKLARMATDLAGTLIQLDWLEDVLLDFGCGLLDQRWVAEQAGGVAIEEIGKGHWATAAGALILVGEYAAACDAVERHAPPELRARLATELMGAIRDAKELHGAALAMRRVRHTEADVPASALLEWALAAGGEDIVRRHVAKSDKQTGA